MRLTEKDIVYIGICAKSHGLCYYVSRSVISDCLRPHGLYVAHLAPLSMESTRQGHWSVVISFSRGSSQPRDGTWLPALQADSFPSEPPGKPTYLLPSFYLLCSLKYEKESRSAVSNSLWPHGLCSPWSSPGQNTGVGSSSARSGDPDLQGIFPTQGWNPGCLHCRRFFTNWAARETQEY